MQAHQSGQTIKPAGTHEPTKPAPPTGERLIEAIAQANRSLDDIDKTYKLRKAHRFMSKANPLTLDLAAGRTDINGLSPDASLILSGIIGNVTNDLPKNFAGIFTISDKSFETGLPRYWDVAVVQLNQFGHVTQAGEMITQAEMEERLAERQTFAEEQKKTNPAFNPDIVPVSAYLDGEIVPIDMSFNVADHSYIQNPVLTQA